MSLLEKKIAYHLGFSDVIRILRLVDGTPFQELQLELGELKVRVVRDDDRPAPVQPTGADTSRTETDQVEPPGPVSDQASPAAPPVTDPEHEGTPVTAPLAGVFYRSPYPGEPPFVEVGSAVKDGDVLGILEIMKLMNHVKAPCSGIVLEICAQNGEFVEFGRMLAVIAPERGANRPSS
ncbi:acetyl-CoA carboxylase biotin carboxyl carrier protein [bacterium]|nr:acetyl-CoA carboxylase biotin carboxyl carrier protein [bacterium]